MIETSYGRFSKMLIKELLNPRAINILAMMYFRLLYKAESCIYALKTLFRKVALDLRWRGARYFNTGMSLVKMAPDICRSLQCVGPLQKDSSLAAR